MTSKPAPDMTGQVRAAFMRDLPRPHGAAEMPLNVFAPRSFADDVLAGVHHAIDELVHNPEEQAAFAGGVLTPVLLTLAGRRPLPFPLFLIASLGGQALGRMAYRARQDLADIARAARDGYPPAGDGCECGGSGHAAES